MANKCKTSTEYWASVNRGGLYSPNSILYRFISDLQINIAEKKILELGFGEGQDLLEMKKRGGYVYGIDADTRMTTKIIKERKNNNFPIVHAGDFMDAGVFDTKFDLIYSLDSIYYIESSKQEECLQAIGKLLNNGGKLILQVITGDYTIEANGVEKFDPCSIINDRSNPISFNNEEYYRDVISKAGLKVIGLKRTSETFFKDARALRRNLYLCCEAL